MRDEKVRVDPMFLNVLINSILLIMEMDTGTYATVISEKTKNTCLKGLELESTYNTLQGYTNEILKPLGSLANLNVRINNKKVKLNCFVLPGREPPLIGRQWLAAFGIWLLIMNIPKEISNCRLQSLNILDFKGQLMTQFKILFGPTPRCFNKGKLVTHVKENIKPVALKTRHVP